METLSQFCFDTIPPLTKKKLSMPLFVLEEQMLYLDLLVAKGAEPGPVMLVVAGVHGDEYEGVFAIHRFFEYLDPGKLRGTLLAIPICNVLAYKNISRESPEMMDGLNLARCFPGSPEGSYTWRLAHELLSFTLRNLTKDCDLFVDLHSAGTFYECVPAVGAHKFSPRLQREVEICRICGIANLWLASEYMPTFNSEVAMRGITSIGAEITGRGGARHEDVTIYENMLRSIASHLHMIDGAYQEHMGIIHRMKKQFSNKTGLFLSEHEVGCKIRKGAPLGFIYSPDGDLLDTVVSAHTGEIWMYRKQSAVREGDMLCMVAEPISANNEGRVTTEKLGR